MNRALPFLYFIVIALSSLSLFALEPAPAKGFGQPGPEEARSELLDLEFEIQITAVIDEVLDGDALRAANAKLGIPEETPPSLMIWCAGLQDHLGQRATVREVSPEPTKLTYDPEYKNKIYWWDFSDKLEPGTTITITRKYDLQLSKYDPQVDKPKAVTLALLDPQLVNLYTRSEDFHQLTPAMTEAADAATSAAAESPQLEQAGAIFDWIRDHMTYKYPPPGGRGANLALEKGVGDCGQYADLFIAMSRTRQIPTRYVGGLAISPDKKVQGKYNVGSHAWAEMLMPWGEWVPVDPSREGDNNFAKIETNTHITCSVGRNIQLPGVPGWASYSMSEVEKGRTDMMQTYTQLRTGWKGKLYARRFCRVK
jgi:hypothetical protein